MPSIFGKKTKTPAPSMFDGGNFKPAKGYSSNNYRIECQNVEYDRCTFVDVMVTEMTLRGLIQHYDRVEKKLEKPVYIPGDKSNVQQWEEELQHLQKEILLKQHELYKNEAFLPHQPLKQMYDSLREDPTWYCRPELVKDCSRRGGCCGRSCGCCQRRHLTTERTKGIGHCTIDCSCCSEPRGADPTSEERETIAKILLEMLRSSNPAYLVKMIEAYFSKPAYFTQVQTPQRSDDYAKVM